MILKAPMSLLSCYIQQAKAFMPIEIDLKFKDVFKVLYHRIITLIQAICFRLLSILLQITIVLKKYDYLSFVYAFVYITY